MASKEFIIDISKYYICLDLARPRTVSSPTSWLASALARSRPGPPAGPRGWPSTTSSSGSRRSWAQTPSTQEQSSEKEFDLIKKNCETQADQKYQSNHRSQ